MTVYFVNRGFDFGPTQKYVKRFEDDNVLDWFRNRWTHLSVGEIEDADARLAEVLGCDGWLLSSPFIMAAERSQPPPDSFEELLSLLRESFPDEVVSDSPHVLQILTEMDGEGGANYFFDDHFLAQSGSLAAFLLHEDWRLPSGCGDGLFVPEVETNLLQPGGEGPGVTYAVLLTVESKSPLDDLMGGYRLEGIRLPELSRHLIGTAPASEDWEAGVLRTLRPLLLAGVKSDDPTENAFLNAIHADPADAVNWAAWSDYREEQGGMPPGVWLLRTAFERIARFPGKLMNELPASGKLRSDCKRLLALEEKHRNDLRKTPQSLIYVEDHLAQLCLDASWSDEPSFHQWIFFDDLWASAHPDLANAILRFAARWDVLSAD